VETLRCKSCDRDFFPCPKVKNQQYCSDPACQKARKRLWQREKLADDEDYRLNQKAAQKAWRDEHPGYWKDYRNKHPDYVTKNRENQRKLRARKRDQTLAVAKMDALPIQPPIIPGTYQLVFLSGLDAHPVAKMDALTVEIRVVPPT
jgi:hypothetical protein